MTAGNRECAGRPEWATLLAWLLIAPSAWALLRVGIETLTEILTLPKTGAFVASGLVSPPSVAMLIGSTMQIAFGIWILKRPRKARSAVWLLAVWTFLSAGALGGLTLRGIYSLPSPPPRITLQVVSLICRAVGAVVFTAALLVFLYTGRRKLFFAGQS